MSYTELFPNQVIPSDLPAYHVNRPELPAPTCHMFEPNHLKLLEDIRSGAATFSPQGVINSGGEVIASIGEAIVYGVRRKIRSLPSNAHIGHLLCKKSI